MKALVTVFGGLAILIVIGIFGALVYRATFWTFVDNYEFAYRFNGQTGVTTPLKNADGSYQHGYVRSFPFINQVHTIDTRPIQLCIGGSNSNTTASGTSSGGGVSSRVLNCKLVQFNPEGYATFIAWHGRADYTHNSLETILMNYAYDQSNQKYPFLTILKELKNEDVQASVPVGVSKNDTVSKKP